MGLFDKRVAFKPFEYPKATEFKDAINHSYWLVTEWNFIGDQHDFATAMTPRDRSIVTNAMLAISQIEVSVKRFWAGLGTWIPKAEFEQVGITFAESEVRHADAYSHLLKVLGLNDNFEKVLEVPAIKSRVKYLSESMKVHKDDRDRDYATVLAMFTMFVENVSLFSQFAIIKSYNKHLCILKDIDNVIQATQKEETIHAMFGGYLLNLMREECPEWFDEGFETTIYDMAMKAYKAECEIIDWIFEAGEPPFLTKQAVKSFVAARLNESLKMIGLKGGFYIHPDITMLMWFHEELHADTHMDFFHKRSTGYAKRVRSVTAGDLF